MARKAKIFSHPERTKFYHDTTIPLVVRMERYAELATLIQLFENRKRAKAWNRFNRPSELGESDTKAYVEYLKSGHSTEDYWADSRFPECTRRVHYEQTIKQMKTAIGAKATHIYVKRHPFESFAGK